LLDALHATERGEIVETRDPRRCDVFHSPWIDGALLRSPVPMVVTLHDLIAIKRRGEYLRSALRLKLRQLAVQRAVAVIVPTRAVAEDAIEVLGIPSDRVSVIAEAPAAPFYPRPGEEVEATRERFALPDRYLLWVGELRAPAPCKRVSALSRAPRRMPLVLVGPTGRWARELPNVTLTGAVSDDELAAIYTGAHALVFPSADEGFGLPPVEALACGAPVAATNLPALREVLGDRASLCDVGDVDALIAVAEEQFRPAPAPPSWSWEDAAKATWNVYDAAVEHRDDGRAAFRAPRGAASPVRH
jgi:alpha-1,3-rhamnosyl/mannosyltransferase